MFLVCHVWQGGHLLLLLEHQLLRLPVSAETLAQPPQDLRSDCQRSGVDGEETDAAETESCA